MIPVNDESARGRAPSGQALAVPVDPSRSMVSYGPDHPDYPNAPSDWDGGPYLCRDGQLYHMRGYGWEHGLGCWDATADWDRIAYHAAIARVGTVQLGPIRRMTARAVRHRQTLVYLEELMGKLTEQIEREIDEATDEREKAIAEYTDAGFKLSAANRRLNAALRARTQNTPG